MMSEGLIVSIHFNPHERCVDSKCSVNHAVFNNQDLNFLILIS